MFLTTFTDAMKLIYVTTKNYLFSNLRSRVFDFLEKREKKNTWYIFSSTRGQPRPRYKKN